MRTQEPANQTTPPTDNQPDGPLAMFIATARVLGIDPDVLVMTLTADREAMQIIARETSIAPQR